METIVALVSGRFLQSHMVDRLSTEPFPNTRPVYHLEQGLYSQRGDFALMAVEAVDPEGVRRDILTARRGTGLVASSGQDGDVVKAGERIEVSAMAQAWAMQARFSVRIYTDAPPAVVEEARV